MGRRRRSTAVLIIKQRFQARAYTYTRHAWSELADDRLSDADVEHAVLYGTLVARQSDAEQGIRYVMKGPGVDGAEVGVVCRILMDRIRIVTVYRV